MPIINLYGPTIDKNGLYVDAGADLAVGDGEHDDITVEAATELVEGMRAVELEPDPA